MERRLLFLILSTILIIPSEAIISVGSIGSRLNVRNLRINTIVSSLSQRSHTTLSDRIFFGEEFLLDLLEKKQYKKLKKVLLPSKQSFTYLDTSCPWLHDYLRHVLLLHQSLGDESFPWYRQVQIAYMLDYHQDIINILGQEIVIKEDSQANHLYPYAVALRLECLCLEPYDIDMFKQTKENYHLLWQRLKEIETLELFKHV